MTWGRPADVFSVGCLIAEISTGRPLFQPSFDAVERLAALEAVIGHFSRGMALMARKSLKGAFREGIPYRVAFPPNSMGEDAVATSEAVARIASLKHLSVGCS